MYQSYSLARFLGVFEGGPNRDSMRAFQQDITKHTFTNWLLAYKQLKSPVTPYLDPMDV
jgi:hypothetical protein